MFLSAPARVSCRSTGSLGQTVTWQDLCAAFLDRSSIDGVSYYHNDHVRIIAGENKGAMGWLVAVLTLEPEPRYVVELESGHDVEVVQSFIENAT